ncbi:MAG: acyl-CoA synthetase [Pseudomonadota bacterium]
MTGHHPSIHAQRAPDKPAYIMADTGETVTYRELDERSNQAAHLLRGAGLKRGDALVIFAENHARFFELAWGAQRAGLYYIPVSWHLTASEILYIINDAGAKLFVASDRFADTAARVAHELSPSVSRFSLGTGIEGFTSYEAVRDQQPVSPITDESAGQDMMYTSGTTGHPKGVKKPLPEGPIHEVDPIAMMFLAEGYNTEAVTLSPGPLYHASPLHNSMYTHRFGGTGIVIDKFDAETMLQLIERYGIKQMNCVPTHFVRLLKLPQDVRDSYDVSTVELVLHTAAPCPVEVKHRLIDWLGPVVLEYYGGTEGIGGAMIRSEEWLAHPGSIGKSVSGGVHVVDEDNWQELPVGETGVIYFEHAAAFEYHNDSEKTKSVSSPQGWMTLGDIGHVDAEGYIYLTDRKANMIISGGVNIYPQESENRLITHPRVVDAAVFGIPHPDFGEEVKAVVQLAEGESASQDLESDLIAYCKEVLSPLKCPRSIDFRAELPRKENGKLYKRLLKDEYLQG